ncbi:peptidylprolyl isomerase [bacterium]|nr:peptidylprolyl isomerase [bacterium]MBU1153594.1 peptidylprolyl isomerase [bacterium]
MNVYGKIYLALIILITSYPVKAEVIERVVVRVNNEVITLLELEEVVNNYTKTNNVVVSDQIKRDLLNEMINEKLILQEAKRQKILVEDAEINQIINEFKANFKDQSAFQQALANENLTEFQLYERYKDQLLKIKILDEEVRSKVKVDNNKVLAELVNYKFKIKTKHILVKEKGLALEILDKIKKGGEFERLAQEYSLCPSGKEGGDLGFFIQGQMVKEFEEVAFSLKEGEISGVVETKFGFHLIKNIEKKEIAPKELEEIKLQIEREFYNEEYQKELRDYLEKLREKAALKVIL